VDAPRAALNATGVLAGYQARIAGS
jgi:hypothetical protein